MSLLAPISIHSSQLTAASTLLKLLSSHCHNIYLSADEGNCTLLISRDLNAAFNTSDHNLLMAQLDNSFSIRGNFLSWIDYHGQISIRPHWPFFPQEHILHLRSASRLRSWANTVQYLYFTHRLYRWIAQHPSTTICRRYTALYCSLRSEPSSKPILCTLSKKLSYSAYE